MTLCRTISVGSALGFALALVTASQGAAADAASGQATFETVCTACHAAAADVAAKVQGDDADGKTAWLNTFLVDHYVPDEATRANLAAYLLSVSN